MSHRSRTNLVLAGTAALLGLLPAGVAAAHGASVTAHRAGDGTRLVEVRDGRVVIQAEPQPDRAWLGVVFETVEDGLKVLSVVPGSPAEEAGFAAGDVLVSFDGIDVEEMTDLHDAMADAKAGDVVGVDVLRDGSPMTLRPRLAERPGRMEFDLKGAEPGGWTWHHDGASGAARGHRAFAWRFSGKPRLGVVLESLSDQLAEYFGVEEGRGILVKEVVAETPAERAGLKAGDVILRLDDTEVASAADIRRALGDVEKGESVLVEVMRRGRLETLRAVIDTEPPAETHGLFVGPGASRSAAPSGDAGRWPGLFFSGDADAFFVKPPSPAPAPPATPSTPAAPMRSVAPVAPVAPVKPVAPVAPVKPVAPPAPRFDAGGWGTWSFEADETAEHGGNGAEAFEAGEDAEAPETADAAEVPEAPEAPEAPETADAAPSAPEAEQGRGRLY